MLGLFVQCPVIDNPSPFTLLLFWNDEGRAGPLTIGRVQSNHPQYIPSRAAIRRILVGNSTKSARIGSNKSLLELSYLPILLGFFRRLQGPFPPIKFESFRLQAGIRQICHPLCVRQRLPQTALPCNQDHWVCLGAAHRLTHCPHYGDLNPHHRARPATPAAPPPASHPSFFGLLTDALRNHLG